MVELNVAIGHYRGLIHQFWPTGGIVPLSYGVGIHWKENDVLLGM
uniref:Uncharacterized protein n=1 Tax=Anguilla anguilla TaxID=7936 RepID=A0A0E9TC19_ANGAN